MEPDIFSRDIGGIPVSSRDPEFAAIREIQLFNRKILAELNSTYHEGEETRALLEKLTGRKIDETVDVWTPFYTDFGRNIRFGKNVFVSINSTFMDRGRCNGHAGGYSGRRSSDSRRRSSDKECASVHSSGRNSGKGN